LQFKDYKLMIYSIQMEKIMNAKIIILFVLISTNIFGENKDINTTTIPCEHHLIKILYGKPTPKALKLVQENKIILGGCKVRDNAPRYYCTKCKKKF